MRGRSNDSGVVCDDTTLEPSLSHAREKKREGKRFGKMGSHRRRRHVSPATAVASLAGSWTCGGGI